MLLPFEYRPRRGTLVNSAKNQARKDLVTPIDTRVYTHCDTLDREMESGEVYSAFLSGPKRHFAFRILTETPTTTPPTLQFGITHQTRAVAATLERKSRTRPEGERPMLNPPPKMR